MRGSKSERRRLPGGQQWMGYFQYSGMWLEMMIVDPTGEHRRFHRRTPRLRERSHLVVQIPTCGGHRALSVNLAAAVLHAVTDLKFAVTRQSWRLKYFRLADHSALWIRELMGRCLRRLT
jgi:hypothetical protein